MFCSDIDKQESKLAIIDPFTNEKTKDLKKDEDNYVEVELENNRVNKLQDDEDDIKLGDSKSSYTQEFLT